MGTGSPHIVTIRVYPGQSINRFCALLYLSYSRYSSIPGGCKVPTVVYLGLWSWKAGFGSANVGRPF